MRAWTTTLLLAALALGPTTSRAECRPSATIERIRVTIVAPEGIKVAGVVVTMAYPTDKLVIEGRGEEAGHAVVSETPEGSVTVSDDRDGELRVVVAQAKALKAGSLFEVTFHRCEGAAPPAPGEVACRVVDASDTMTAKISDVRCTIGTSS